MIFSVLGVKYNAWGECQKKAKAVTDHKHPITMQSPSKQSLYYETLDALQCKYMTVNVDAF